MMLFHVNIINKIYLIKIWRRIIMSDDYLLDDEDAEGQYFVPLDEEDDSAADEDDDDDISDVDDSNSLIDERDSSETGLTANDIMLMSAYDSITRAGKDPKVEDLIGETAAIVIRANPKHTSDTTVGYKVMEILGRQGRTRSINLVYTPEHLPTSEEVSLDFMGDDDAGVNTTYTLSAKEQIARFIDYLVNRDLSKDSIISRRRKHRHLPAFIILLFSSGLYDLIIECPTMPEEYNNQIQGALRKIMQAKYDIVEELALKYEELGRQAVADRVRKLQLSWFAKEPAEVLVAASLRDLALTYEDIAVYREFRARYTNMSRAITQDVISDLIEVVIDKDSGIYEKLKDKTRSEAIADVKKVYQDWSKDNPADMETASKVIYKDVAGLKED